MVILGNVLFEILHKVPCPPPEMGGILGGRDGVISSYAVDAGLQRGNRYARYYPDVNYLNSKVRDWAREEISFYGMFHSHFPGGDQLSLTDERYIRQIMLAMPSDVNKLFFPIVLPTGMIGYQAIRCGSEIRISRDDIEIV